MVAKGCGLSMEIFSKLDQLIRIVNQTTSLNTHLQISNVSLQCFDIMDEYNCTDMNLEGRMSQEEQSVEKLLSI